MLTENIHFQTVNGKFPRIGQKLSELWGTKDLSAYLNELMTDTRDGKRQGFPPEVATALFSLMFAHDNEFPEHVHQAVDIWSLGTYEMTSS